MFYLNKIVGFLINPAVTALVMGGVAVIMARMGRRSWAKWIGIVAVGWLWFWMMPITGRIVGAPLESEFLKDGMVPDVESFPKADAIVLLGGGIGVETNWSGHAEMNSNADRIWQAARLWKHGTAQKVIATGPNVRESTGGLLMDFGVTEISTVFLSEPRNTEEEAKAVRNVLRMGNGERGMGNGGIRVLLVTSAWHMKRARLMFEKYAPEVEVVCAPADFENTLMAKKPFSLLEFFPDPSRFYLNFAALREWVGLVGYMVFRL